MTTNDPNYVIAVRKNKESGFVLMLNSDNDRPKWFYKNTMPAEYARLVIEFGGENVIVSELKFLFLKGHVEEVSPESPIPWAKSGTFVFEHEE